MCWAFILRAKTNYIFATFFNHFVCCLISTWHVVAFNKNHILFGVSIRRFSVYVNRRYWSLFLLLGCNGDYMNNPPYVLSLKHINALAFHFVILIGVTYYGCISSFKKNSLNFFCYFAKKFNGNIRNNYSDCCEFLSSKTFCQKIRYIVVFFHNLQYFLFSFRCNLSIPVNYPWNSSNWHPC